MSDLHELLEEFKTIRESNAKTLWHQEQFRKTLQEHTEQYATLESQLSRVLREVNTTVGSIPKSVEVVETQTLRVEPKSWYYLGGFLLLLLLSIWLTPSAKQRLRELQLEQEYNEMKTHLDYHIANNPKTERRWQSR